MSALDNLDNNLSGDSVGGFGSLGGYVNQVYLGEKPSKEVRMKRSGKTITTPAGARTISVPEAKALYLKDPKVEAQWLQTLRKNGVDTSDKIKNRALWDIAVAGASDWYATSGGTQKITPEQYANWYLGGQKKAPKADLSRSIYQYSPEQIDAKADEITRDIGGFAVTDEVKAQPWYKDLTKAINEMVMRGTVTTTKQVKNPKTGKIENVTIQKPEVTTEAITEKIKTAVMAADPISVERKQNLEFADWAMKKMGGNR
jgi:hypothetical protein